MADNNVEQNSLVKPLEPGVDHPSLVVPFRENVAEQTGVPVADVTPLDEAAEERMKNQTDQFVKDVAGVEQKELTTNPADSQKDESDNIGEVLRVLNPFTNTIDLDRTTSNKEPIDLEEERKRRMEDKKVA